MKNSYPWGHPGMSWIPRKLLVFFRVSANLLAHLPTVSNSLVIKQVFGSLLASPTDILPGKSITSLSAHYLSKWVAPI